MITDLVKKLGASTSKWYKDKILTTKLLLKATQMDLDKSAQKLVAQNVDPDRVYTLLKLQKDSNKFVGKSEFHLGYPSGEYKLWQKLTEAWKTKYPTWVSKLNNVDRT
ncbi:hypothetical protein JG687_00017218 [Phytophthora cactorum]|uniref:RxLR effector protein n=1 Tax=Phytophthora cactorum TaxID=29920 RepID=A0A329RPM0_9STRA|nr:hypothetical protein Pcac1_g6736 [Phytophthora cactorum]KAG2796360.1 hypothetical protein PC111_g21760 [Phytophthora cactorum]KAG2796686.1 hypothetical protein PC112_g22096 [Phytophthora cactorum]KAG2855083.1 hypothetical protein PC113_g12748 [Phytophthora cactorum]KAG2901058.1 hypothetical protein PC114_g13335 [Phytophthora cactorum]